MQTLKDISATVKTLVTAKDKSELLELVVRARKEDIELLDENSKLKEQIKSHDQFDEKMKYYSQVQLNGNWVYRHNTNSDLYVCPHCVEERRKIHPLQRKSEILHQCFSCEKFFQLHSDQTDYSKSVSIDWAV